MRPYIAYNSEYDTLSVFYPIFCWSHMVWNNYILYLLYKYISLIGAWQSGYCLDYGFNILLSWPILCFQMHRKEQLLGSLNQRTLVFILVNEKILSCSHDWAMRKLWYKRKFLYWLLYRSNIQIFISVQTDKHLSLTVFVYLRKGNNAARGYNSYIYIDNMIHFLRKKIWEYFWLFDF